jgi:hypothetical protein
MDQTAASLQKHALVLHILYLAFFSAILLNLGLLFLLPAPAALLRERESLENLIRVFYGLGAALVLAIAILRRRMAPVSLKGVADELELARGMVRNRMSSLIIWVCGEAVSLLGLILYLLTGVRSHGVRFMLVSILLMTVFYPRRGNGSS